MTGLKAALHVHSTYSDGEMSLREVRDLLVSDGCRLVGMADHADTFDAARLKDYVAECASLSDDRILLLPGLEFGCARRMHIVGYGVVALPRSDDPSEVIEFIRARNGVAVIAHPAPEHLEWIPTFASLPDGIEAWNTKYDGPAAPRPSVFDLIVRLQAVAPDVLAFYGLDLHWRHQHRALFTEVMTSATSPPEILDALRRGRFAGVSPGLLLPSDGRVSAPQLVEFGERHARSQRVRRLAQGLKKLARPVARLLPAGVKSQLRRFL